MSGATSWAGSDVVLLAVKAPFVVTLFRRAGMSCLSVVGFVGIDCVACWGEGCPSECGCDVDTESVSPRRSSAIARAMAAKLG